VSENHGFDDVWLSEHHFIDDGYLPSILPVAAAIAARTRQIRIISGVLLMPFHNPLRLAEEIALADVISGGRLNWVSESALNTKSSKASVYRSRNGEPEPTSHSNSFVVCSAERISPSRANFFDLKNIRVTPEPVQRPHPPVWLGGFTPAALRRAARYGDGFTMPVPPVPYTIVMSQS
jgi:alkanesulfonate monooxygenase SsuD/methylene tetrahydromethanopterin reductase-like flavin-dependent oxidoreductase (luciferase family)